MQIEAGDLVEVKALAWNQVDSLTYTCQTFVEDDEDAWGKGHYNRQKPEIPPKYLFIRRAAYPWK
jgi:hypothetical protein